MKKIQPLANMTGHFCEAKISIQTKQITNEKRITKFYHTRTWLLGISPSFVNQG